MDTQKLLAKPKPKIQAKITKINNLVEVSVATRKTSIALRKTFEKGVYQRKTQLSVLNRYKKRLDDIQKEQDAKLDKQVKKKPTKIEIPKFKGSFFAAGSADDPLRAIGALAAFTSLEKIFDGNLSDAFSPGMVAAGALFGPGIFGLLGGAAEGLFKRGSSQKKVLSSSQQKHFDKSGKSSVKSTEGIDAASKGGKAVKSFSKFGASIIPGIGAVVGVADAALRAQSGDTTGAAIAGTGAALDATAATLAATGVGLPIAGLLSIGSFVLDATNLIRDLTGVSAREEDRNEVKLKEQEKKQKALVSGGGNLTFSKTLTSYEKALVKFELFSNSFRRQTTYQDEGGGSQPPAPPAPADVYDGPISGDQFYPLPGGILSTRDVGVAGGEYGAPRSYGGHSGQDIGGKDPGAPVIAWKTGKIRYSGSVEAGDTVLIIDHGGGLQSVYKHVVPTVPSGTVVYGGQQIATLFNSRAYAPHLHFEVWKDGAHKNPMAEIQSSQKIPAPLTLEKAKGGMNMGGISYGPKSGYFKLLHGEEAVIPLDNNHTQYGGDPLQNIPVNVIGKIMNRSKKYQFAMDSMPPEIIEVPVPVIPPRVQYVSSGSASLNIQSDADRNLLKMLYYNALG